MLLKELGFVWTKEGAYYGSKMNKEVKRIRTEALYRYSDALQRQEKGELEIGYQDETWSCLFTNNAFSWIHKQHDRDCNFNVSKNQVF